LREGGVYHFLMIAGKGGRANIELDEKAISALATAIAAIEKNPARVNEFAINKTLSLTCEPPGFVLRNCAASHKFPAFEHLNALWERLREAALIAQLTERS
jgi:hypothetical protein